MGRALAKLGGGLVVVIAAIGIVFFVGMRTKNPAVQNAVRRMNRAVLNPRQLGTAGTPGAYASIIRHVGRSSGRAYETPVGALSTADGFVIALPYGPRTDWVRNVVASGSATLVHEGAVHEVDRPEVVPMSAVEACFPPGDRRAHRLFAIEECLLLRRAGDEGAVESVS